MVVTVCGSASSGLMRAAASLFRFRLPIFLFLYFVGFAARWGRDTSGTLWLAAPTLLARTGWIGLAQATLTVTIGALACLVLGAVLRVCGTAFLGSTIMQGAIMQGEHFVACGPYRYVRNPLYLGAWLLAVGVSILMPLSGALLFLPAFSLFAWFLIWSEERFLSAKQPEVYEQYRSRVPRLIPRLRAAEGLATARPRWLQAVLAETYPIAFSLCFAVFAWRYNAHILIRCLLVCFGLSLIMRALSKERPSEKIDQPSRAQERP
jgi:protein-S-isoprenylcysteine O-methyltransferase Ste14